MKSVKKLAIAGFVLAGVTGYMAYLGAAGSWQYYLTADECLANQRALAGSRVRVNGRIAAGSLQITENRKGASFALQAAAGRLPVVSSAAPPDNLTEEMDVVVEGKIGESGVLAGEKILTRCATKYRSQGSSGRDHAPGLSRTNDE